MISLITTIYKEGYRLFSCQKLKERKAKARLATFVSWQRAGKERRLPNSVAEHTLQAEMIPPLHFQTQDSAAIPYGYTSLYVAGIAIDAKFYWQAQGTSKR